ncbi:MAG TPA: aminotransferase class I/II-fold pyridoxal phosphate-dependent enzyme [Nannocystaceae bacterium]|nr:aminotransferase class I/II-fold pyridoxal phosphate-dependent enzyme [Nannocystaceae bacterium]
MTRKLDTELVHAGEPRPRIAGAVVTPIFQSSTFELDGDAGYHDIRYLRLSNSPSHVALHGKLAAIEGAEAALATASGMAAISTALLSVLGSGDHMIAQRCLYGGTHDLVVHDLSALGITTTFVDAEDPAAWKAALRPNTKAFYCETLTNPTLELADLRGIAAFAKQHGLVSLIDSTFASPVNFKPLAHGFDLVLHSATKYLNGHSDIVAGAVMGSAALVQRVKHKLDHFGGSIDPHACFLLQRGLKTLGVRVRQQNASALAIARALVEHDAVALVRYPGLPSHPQHARARELLAGFGGILSFELKGGLAAAQALFDTVELAVDAPSVGGPETLLTRPAQTSHKGLSQTERAALGITDGLVRMSVGLEDPADLIDDLRRALAR